MTLETICAVLAAAVAFFSLLTPLLRLNSLLARLNTTLEEVHARTERCEERLDAHERRFARAEAKTAACAEATREAHRRLDELTEPHPHHRERRIFTPNET